MDTINLFANDWPTARSAATHILGTLLAGQRVEPTERVAPPQLQRRLLGYFRGRDVAAWAMATGTEFTIEPDFCFIHPGWCNDDGACPYCATMGQAYPEVEGLF